MKPDTQARPDQVPLPHDEGNAEVEVENADLEFVNEFGGNLGFLETLNAKSLDKQVQKGPARQQAKHSANESGSDNDDQGPEAAYERGPRQRLREQQQSTQQAGLPTKNFAGELVYAKTKSSRLHAPSTQVSGVLSFSALAQVPLAFTSAAAHTNYFHLLCMSISSSTVVTECAVQHASLISLCVGATCGRHYCAG